MTVCMFNERSLQDIYRRGSEEEKIDWSQFSCLQRPLLLEILQRPEAWLLAAAAEGHGSSVGLVTQRGFPMWISIYVWVSQMMVGYCASATLSEKKGRVTFF